MSCWCSASRSSALGDWAQGRWLQGPDPQFQPGEEQKLGYPGIERGEKMGISQEPLALLTGAPEPAPAIPTMGSFPTSACQLGHPQLLQSAEGTDSSELFFRERKTTSKSGQEEHSGFHPREDTREKLVGLWSWCRSKHLLCRELCAGICFTSLLFPQG